MDWVNFRQTIFAARFLKALIAPSIRLRGRWLCNLLSLFGWSNIVSWHVWVYRQVPRIKVIGFLRLFDKRLLAVLSSPIRHMLTNCWCAWSIFELWLGVVLISWCTNVCLKRVVRIVPVKDDVRSRWSFASVFVALLCHNRVVLPIQRCRHGLLGIRLATDSWDFLQNWWLATLGSLLGSDMRIGNCWCDDLTTPNRVNDILGF